MEAAASIIAFGQVAAAIGKCVIKAKKLWDQAQDLPDEIQALILRLQGYESIFQVMDKQYPNQQYLQTLPTYSLVQDNLKVSMGALALLRDNADHLITKLDAKKGMKRKLAAVKMILGKDSSDQLKDRLNDSIALLNLSCQAWNMTMTMLTPDLIAARLTQTLKTHYGNHQLSEKPTIEAEEASKPCQDVKAIEHNRLLPRSNHDKRLRRTYTPSKLGRFAMAYTTSTGAWQAYIQWPSWLSASVYELQSSPSLGGWSYNYRVYNIISPKSEIIQKIENGDKNGVLELFNTRKASPFDKDDEGHSLLYYAAESKRFELCQLFLSLGLQNALTDRVGKINESPLTPLVFNPNRRNPEQDWMKISDLFQSYLDEPETNMILRLFDCGREWAHGDEFAMIFRQRFMPKFYTGPLNPRLEAFRLGSFHMDSTGSLKRLLSQDRQITSFDVSQSSQEKLSLVHSAAVAMSIRFADEAIPQKRGAAQWPLYNDSWGYLVEQVAKVASVEDLHSYETVQPWDVYHVPIWSGTPLVSVIGGALCYLSPDVSFYHWDSVFQQSLQEWARNLQAAGADLTEYGRREADMLKEKMRGALDSNAIATSRNSVRDSLPSYCATLKVRERAGVWNDNHWVPVRLLDLKFGPFASDWQIVWAPEFEWMACEFWKMIERQDPVMPGSWVDS
ncbi:hypothetical protein KAF25_006302 [Fusarium avenaceum]|uniref:NACHT-NTPase and P-loop NTPases N-terminal domain-containing protein n=1 Tax=Fusarium avenaceum TaxID=40199 RepID=A0A9P7HF92_9HYPO|nr:hypothetical protein KAF25_006302 [Fusarium avenaceum]